MRELKFLPSLFLAWACLYGATAAALSLAPTPPDMLGPYYPDVLPADQDGDLVQIRGQVKEATGQRLLLLGRVLETSGAPIAGARVEIWQTDANGRYIHTQDAAGKPRDPFFQGFGSVTTGSDGSYRFRTIVPVAYGSRPPHIHVRVVASGRPPLVTQLYFSQRVSEPGLPLEGAAERQARQTLRLDAAGGSLKGAFDLVLAPAGQ